MGEAGQKPSRMATPGVLEAHDSISTIDDKAELQQFEQTALKLTLTIACRHCWWPTGMQRKRVLANGGLPEVHLGACQQAVVDFMFAAKPGIGE